MIYQNTRRTLYVIAGLTLILILWASFGTMEELARADGKVVPSDQVKILQNLEGGIVVDIQAKPGQAVKAGDLLFRLSSVQYGADLESLKKQVTILKIREQRLLAEINDRPPAYPAELLADMKTQVDLEVKEYLSRREKVSYLKESFKSAQEEYAIIEQLVKRGLEPKAELMRSQRARSERGLALQSHMEMTSSELNRVSAELAPKQEQLKALADKLDRTEIVSPINGVISKQYVTNTGGVIKPGEPLAEIVPSEDQLVVEAQLKPEDVALVRPGMTARVKLTAYDSAVFGGFEAKVAYVAADATVTQDGKNFYLIKLESPKPFFRGVSKELPIMPGMVAQVDIITGKRTFLQYIFKPLNQVAKGSFTER
jgi:adhesin transport system membrane fusion protein